MKKTILLASVAALAAGAALAQPAPQEPQAPAPIRTLNSLLHQCIDREAVAVNSALESHDTNDALKKQIVTMTTEKDASAKQVADMTNEKTALAKQVADLTKERDSLKTTAGNPSAAK